MNRIIFNGRIKNHQTPTIIQKRPIIHIMNCGTKLNLLKRYVAGPDKTTTTKINDTIMAKLAINFHPRYYSTRLLHLHLDYKKNYDHHKESNLLHRLILLGLHLLLQ